MPTSQKIIEFTVTIHAYIFVYQTITKLAFPYIILPLDNINPQFYY